jgi:tryptophan-rich sensory protein
VPQQKFGLPCPPHASSEAAIDTYEATVASLGVRLESGGRWRIYAPYGLSDVFNLVVRPNPVLATRDVYEAKTARWQGQWPSLTVHPWRVLPAIAGRAAVMPENDDRSSRRRSRLRQAGAWVGAVGVYAAAQGLSAWAAQRDAGRGTRPQYSQFERPAFAPPGAVFPVAWSALNLTTASSAWLVWRARDLASPSPRSEALAWWGAAVVIRSGYVPLAFGRRRLWAATADAALLSAVMTRYAFLARGVDQTAALLAIPEVAWTAFATALSAAIAAKDVALSRQPGTSRRPPRRRRHLLGGRLVRRRHRLPAAHVTHTKGPGQGMIPSLGRQSAVLELMP